MAPHIARPAASIVHWRRAGLIAALLALALVAGGLADLYGRRRVWILGGVLFSLWKTRSDASKQELAAE